MWKKIKNISEKLRAEFDEGSRLLSRLQTYQRMQHEVRTRSKFVVNRIFNVTQGQQFMKMLIVDFGLETTYNQWNSVLPKTDKICKTSYDGYLFAPGWAWKRNSGNIKYNMDVE